MKTLHLYLARQVLAALVMTVFVFTLMLLMGNVIKDILKLLVNGQGTLGLVCHGILLLLPWLLAFSLPIGMLTATLLVFGRFSADQELTAARASGVSLVSLVAPVLVMSAAVSGLCGWLNCQLAPASRTAFHELMEGAMRSRPGGFMLSKQYVKFGKYEVYAGYVHADGTNLEDVIVSEYDTDGMLVRWAKAPSGTILIDNEKQEATLQMPGMTCFAREKSGWLPQLSGEAPIPPVGLRKAEESYVIPISDMTHRQLRGELERQERGLSSIPPRDASEEELLAAQKQIRDAGAKTIMPVLFYLNQQVAFSFACFGFTLIGIPLGIRAHRRETSVGVMIALGLVIVYYAFMVLGQAWAAQPERYPCLIVWLPNFLFQAVGAVMLWRINKRVG